MDLLLTYCLVSCIFGKFPSVHPLVQKDPIMTWINLISVIWQVNYFVPSIIQEKKKTHIITVTPRTSMYNEQTWKQIGGGSSFIKTTAAGGTGNTPPGTGCKPGAEGETRREHQHRLHVGKLKPRDLHTAFHVLLPSEHIQRALTKWPNDMGQTGNAVSVLGHWESDKWLHIKQARPEKLKDMLCWLFLSYSV